MGVRMLSRDRLPELEATLAERGYRMEFWNVFTGAAQRVTAACDRVLAAPPPEGLTPVPEARRADAAFLEALRAMMSENGIVPFSSAMLAGRVGGPSALAALQDRAGRIAACAFAYFPHNRHSPHAHTAWGGLVAGRPGLPWSRSGYAGQCHDAAQGDSEHGGRGDLRAGFRGQHPVAAHSRGLRG